MKMTKYFRVFMILMFAGILAVCNSSSDSTHTLGVQVEGLNGNNLVLQNNLNGDELAIPTMSPYLSTHQVPAYSAA